MKQVFTHGANGPRAGGCGAALGSTCWCEKGLPAPAVPCKPHASKGTSKGYSLVHTWDTGLILLHHGEDLPLGPSHSLPTGPFSLPGVLQNVLPSSTKGSPAELLTNTEPPGALQTAGPCVSQVRYNHLVHQVAFVFWGFFFDQVAFNLM